MKQHLSNADIEGLPFYYFAMQVFDLLTRIRDISPTAAHALLGRTIPRIIPLSDGMRVRVDEWTPTRCALSIPLIKRNRNHIGSMYVGAQITLADLTAGILLFQRFPMGPYGGVIKRLEADFKRKGKGRLRCIAELCAETVDTLESVRTSADGKVEAWLPMQLLERDDTLVTQVRALVAIKRFRTAET